ncbi:unnamed protein product, partial [Oppiella nova]
MAQQMKRIATEDMVQEDNEEVIKDIPQMYAKDSLDRFGDDLCEHILSYLTLDDRFRCECMSKQWQRLVYTTVCHITINEELTAKMRGKKNLCGENFFDVSLIATIAKKCPHIESIDCRRLPNNAYEPRVLETIDDSRDNCLKSLRRIYANFSHFDRQNFDHLFHGLGPMVTELDLRGVGSWRSLIPLCPNLHRLTVDYLSHVFTESADKQLLAKNLQHFAFKMSANSDVQIFDEFVAHNQSLESLVVNNPPQVVASQDIVTGFLTRLTRLPHLRELVLIFKRKSGAIQYSIGERLHEIGLMCPKLKRFQIQMRSQTPQLNVDVLNAISVMKRLKRLKLNLEVDPPVVTNWRAFDSVNDWPKGLTHLSLHLWHNHYNLFRHLETNLQKLQILHISDKNS